MWKRDQPQPAVEKKAIVPCGLFHTYLWQLFMWFLNFERFRDFLTTLEHEICGCQCCGDWQNLLLARWHYISVRMEICIGFPILLCQLGLQVGLWNLTSCLVLFVSIFSMKIFIPACKDGVCDWF